VVALPEQPEQGDVQAEQTVPVKNWVAVQRMQVLLAET
jgi:hypothetical protein